MLQGLLSNWLVWLIALLFALCNVGCHPYTEIAAVGYKNVGFEKQLEFDLVKPDGITPLQIDTNHDGKPDTYVWRATVHNDATKAYEYNAMIVHEVSSFAGKVLDAAVAIASRSGSAGPAPSAPSAGPGDKLSAILSDPTLGPLVTQFLANNGIVVPSPTHPSP